MVSHLDKNNSPTMVDVGDKNITQRIAEAEGEVIFDKNSFKKIESLKSKKGSIKNIAILAGIMGSKETSRLIPLCHNIPIDAVDIEINKNITQRIAKAEGEVIFDKDSFKKIESLKSKKGSIKNIAILAGIMGAKETSKLIPLCHNIPIDAVNIEIVKNIKKNSMKVKAIVKTSSKTGVEMEALTAVSISALTIYDMCKSVDKTIIINSIKLIHKSGGKTGIFNG